MSLREIDIHTGLYTPGFLVAFGAREISFARENGYPLSLLTIRMDNLELDDEFLEQELKAIGDLIREKTGEGSLVGRINRNEIVVLLPGTRTDKARKVMKSIKKAISRIKNSDRIVPGGNFSFGFASTDKGYTDFSDMLNSARGVKSGGSVKAENQIPVKPEFMFE